MAKQSVSLDIPAPKVQRLEVKVIGDSPLIMHRWSEKAKKQMRDKQMGKATQGKEPKDPEREYEESMYRHNGNYGFPSVGFKAAMVSACRLVDDIPMTLARQAFHVEGEMVEIEGEPRMREDMVRLHRKTADIRYRGEFPKWSAKFIITYAANTISAEQVINLLNLAGFSVGVGEWRPERSGSYGRFHVADKDE